MDLIKPKLGTKPKAVIYARVSTVDQAETGHSLDVQRDKLTKIATDNGWDILEVFHDDGRSARTMNRPDLEALLDFCDDKKDSVDILLVQDTSRLCRNVSDHLQIKAFLKKRAIKLVSLDGNFGDSDEGQFLDLIIAGVNELESKRTGRKTKRIMVALAEKGLKPGSAPVGYINSFRKGIPMAIDLGNKYLIQEIFKLWNTGNYSLIQLSDIIYEKGLRAKSGKKIGKSGIELLLKNIDYAGYLKYEGKIYKGMHDPIISLDDYERAQIMFEKRNRGADRGRKYITLLSGIVHCFKCGSLMYGDYHEDGNYYKCTRCKKTNVTMKLIDDGILDFFNGSTFTDKGLSCLKEVLIKVKDSQSKSAPQHRKSLEERKKEIDRKMRMLEDKMFSFGGLVDEERVKERYLPLKDALKQVEKQLAGIAKPSNNLKNSEIDKVLWGLVHMGELYDSLTLPQRKQFIHFFILKVFIEKERGIVDIALIPEFEELISGDLVRITNSWLLRLDSNQ